MRTTNWRAAPASKSCSESPSTENHSGGAPGAAVILTRARNFRLLTFVTVNGTSPIRFAVSVTDTAGVVTAKTGLALTAVISRPFQGDCRDDMGRLLVLDDSPDEIEVALALARRDHPHAQRKRLSRFV